jgi:hypothetical protein
MSNFVRFGKFKINLDRVECFGVDVRFGVSEAHNQFVPIAYFNGEENYLYGNDSFATVDEAWQYITSICNGKHPAYERTDDIGDC